MLNARRSFLALLAVSAIGGGAAYAQTPTFSLANDVVAAPGTTAVIPLQLTGGVADTAAINVTIRVSAAQANLIGNISAQAGSAPAGLVFQENSDLTAPDSGKEYRLVVYAPSSPVATFNSSSNSTVVNLQIPIAATAPIGSVIDLSIPNGNDGFETRNGALIGLLSVSDASGASVVADSNGDTTRNPASDRPLATAGRITVGAAGFPTTVDFGPTGGNGDWKWTQFLPFSTPDPGVQIVGSNAAGSGFRITLADTDGVSTSPGGVYFGAYDYILPGGATSGLWNPPQGMLLRSRWTVASTAAERNQSPILRSRSSAPDASTSTESILQGPFTPGDGAAATVPTAGNDKVSENYAFVNDVVKNGAGPDGYNTPFDVYHTAGIGTEGTETTLKTLVVDVVNPNALGSGTAVFSRNFQNDGAGPFSAFGTNPIPGSLGVVYGTDGGLSITPQGAPTSNGTVISFGFFEAANLFTIDSTKLYKVTATVGTTVTAANQMPTFRLRFLESNGFSFANLTTFGTLGDNAGGATAGNDKAYVTYASFPAEVNGKPCNFAFDVAKQADFTADAPVILRSLTIEAFDKP